MLKVNQILSQPRQTQTLTLPDGSSVVLEIYFRPMQYGWFLNNLTYNTFLLQSLRITNSPNMLHQWRNLIPFGLACFSVDNREPSLIQDFSSGNSTLYILTAAEVEQYTEFLSGSTN